MNVEAIAWGALVGALWELLMHFFRWELFIKRGQLPRLAAYTLGTLGILLGVLVWAWQMHGAAVPALEAFGAVALICTACGLAVFGAWAVDALGARLHYAQTRDAMDRAVDAQSTGTSLNNGDDNEQDQ